MANPFGEKNIGPWEGQQVEYIPLDDLVLGTENPRDPLDGDYTNDDVIRRATDGRNEKQWQLSKLSKEMGDRFDLSELPTVCRIDDGPKYRVYDGNRRVILAMLRKAGLTTEGQQQLVPPDFPDPIPCNVCDEETALENVERELETVRAGPFHVRLQGRPENRSHTVGGAHQGGDEMARPEHEIRRR